jgi:hypothetical protein
MTTIKQRVDQIKDKRKQTPFRDFLKDIVSRQPIVFYKTDGIVSRFPKTDRIKSVVKYSDFDKVNEDIFNRGQDYDFNKTFRENYNSLFQKVSLPSMIHFFQNENADYGDVVSKSKNIYLSAYVANTNEDVYYSFGIKDGCANVFSSVLVADHSENIYMSCGVMHSFKVFYSRYITNSSDIRFSTNLIGCAHCINCDGLENVSYAINNQVMSKEEYEIKKSAILQQTHNYLTRYQQLSTQPKNVASTDVQGTFLIESQNVENGHFAYRLNNGRNVFNVGWFESNEDLYDCFDGGGPTSADMYGVNGFAISSEHCAICCHIPNCSNVYYSYYIESCSYCLWCVGIKNKQFCIFNKQYTKEERFILADKIFAQMEREWVLGDFFPASLCPFYFNDTIAQIVGNFDKSDVTKDGFLRRDDEIKVDIPATADIIRTDDVLLTQRDDSVLAKVIKDSKGNYYRIIKSELAFHKQYALPLSTLHWMDRIKLHFVGLWM